jgi:UDP-glucose 4-epimerase
MWPRPNTLLGKLKDNMTNYVMVTGAAGYIGGQTALMLKDQGYEVIGVDLRPTPELLENVFTHYFQSDFSDQQVLNTIAQYQPRAIVHCAGTSLVGPSLANPSYYYHNNFVKTKIMADFLVDAKIATRLIFSSTAAIYGDPVMTPCSEFDPPMPISPYGESKLMVEIMLNSYHRAYGLDSVIFRYFNACGADHLIRHGQADDATHIMACLLKSIKDNQPFVLNGNSYPTADGTCVRDYVHVEDIAQAHILAINTAVPSGVYNLGNNVGTSNQQVIDMVGVVTDCKPQVEVGEARSGDPAELFADSLRFREASGWIPKYALRDMIQHAWAWCNR